MDPKQDIVPTPEQAVDVARESRRRLLKAGAVGAPLILTFRSTSAWAVSAGCLIKNGDKPIPGYIPKVNEQGEPILKDGLTKPKEGKPWSDSYKSIYVSESVGDPATGQMEYDKLRALVYNNNIGETCLMSISGGDKPGDYDGGKKKKKKY
jgi:hypothetical protein